MRKTKGKKRTALVASFYALMLMWSATTPALEHEEAGAQLAIGRMYERGIGVPQDYAKAVEWYRRAAEQGLARAQYNLGRMYDYGRGVTQDYAKAVKWYRRAAEQEFAGAQNDLGFMYETGPRGTTGLCKAVEWYRRAADQGGARAQNNLGAMYQQGRGVPQDYAKAVEWYRRAADQGDGFAQLNLGFIIRQGARGAKKQSTRPYVAEPSSFQQARDAGAARCSAQIFFGDEAGVRSDFHSGGTWGDGGRHPSCPPPGRDSARTSSPPSAPKGSFVS